MDALTIIGLAAVVGGLVPAARSVRLIQPHERGVVVRLGRMRGAVRGPGPTFVLPGIDRLRKVSLRVVVVEVAAQDVITRDRVAVSLHALVSFHVADPVKALFNVDDHLRAVPATARAAIRAAISRVGLGDLLSNRDDLNADLTATVGAAVDDAWGVQVDRVQLEDLGLPESLTRVMTRQVQPEHRSAADITPARYVPDAHPAKGPGPARVRGANPVAWSALRSPMDC
jgi:regulator of protease activity HflC (stomatin/prohibitin superfamily)